MSVAQSPRGVGKTGLRIALGGLAVLFMIAAWVALRAITKAKESPAEPEPAVVKAAPAPTTPINPAPVPAPTTPTNTDPVSTPEVATTVQPEPRPPRADEPPIDAIVAKEAPKYGAAKTVGPGWSAVAVKVAEKRSADQVAAEIDRIVDARLAAEKLPVSALADDAEFLRRVYLDLTGCVPPVAKVKSFLADKTPSKRTILIDELLLDHDTGLHFANYWHELLVKRDPESNRPIQTHDVYVKWMTRRFNENKPWNQTVRAMLTAEGDQALAGETFFILANSENGQPAPDKLVATSAALFLGNQLQCCECHVHPIVPGWTQQDFWGLAAFFGKTHATRNAMGKNPTDVLARIGEGPAPKGKNQLGLLADGSIPIPDPRNEGKTIGTARAKLFGEGFTAVPADSINRGYVADWFVSPKNPYFPRASVNRVWSQLMSRGLINPLDDIRPDSKPSHPELLELLAEEFIVSGFDLKHVMRSICRSQAYQRSSRAVGVNRDDEELYSHAAIKAIPPRALFSSLSRITDNQIKMPKEDHGGKGGDAVDGFGFFDVREYDENPTEYTNGVPQLLRLMNTQLPPACDAVARALAKKGGSEQAIEQLYLLVLSRYPTTAETAKMTKFISTHKDPVAGYSAAMWVLLHTTEFFNNH